jgi:N-acetylneuraminate lyase
MNPLAGLVAATLTPLHADGSLWLDRISPLVDRLLARGVRGLYVCGSTGEGPLLTGAERRAVAEAFVRAAAGRLPVVVQVGHNSLYEARELAAHAAAVGADAISATPPTYFRPSSLEGVLDSIASVAAGAPELPFFYYHIPAITGVQVDIAKLVAAAHTRIAHFAGVKFSSPTVYDFLTLDLETTRVLFGVDEMLLAGLTAGAHGAVGSTYNLIPETYNRVIDALASDDLAAARHAQRQATAIVLKLIAHGGLPAIKGAMALTGMPVGPARSPLAPFAEGQLAALKSDLATLEFDALAAFNPGA